jgi:hypothetical protein
LAPNMSAVEWMVSNSSLELILSPCVKDVIVIAYRCRLVVVTLTAFVGTEKL